MDYTEIVKELWEEFLESSKLDLILTIFMVLILMFISTPLYLCAILLYLFVCEFKSCSNLDESVINFIFNIYLSFIYIILLPLSFYKPFIKSELYQVKKKHLKNITTQIKESINLKWGE